MLAIGNVYLALKTPKHSNAVKLTICSLCPLLLAHNELVNQPQVGELILTKNVEELPADLSLIIVDTQGLQAAVHLEERSAPKSAFQEDLQRLHFDTQGVSGKDRKPYLLAV